MQDHRILEATYLSSQGMHGHWTLKDFDRQGVHVYGTLETLVTTDLGIKGVQVQDHWTLEAFDNN